MKAIELQKRKEPASAYNFPPLWQRVRHFLPLLVFYTKSRQSISWCFNRRSRAARMVEYLFTCCALFSGNHTEENNAPWNLPFISFRVIFRGVSLSGSTPRGGWLGASNEPGVFELHFLCFRGDLDLKLTDGGVDWAKSRGYPKRHSNKNWLLNFLIYVTFLWKFLKNRGFRVL